ncbi:hypothetical protein VPNG_09618 [Cytospora leucostoma]|uniref:Uncharacterized protein n=1 Tax=Cytospora leucostoma TaxID=1230097 RepID=A0A423VR43_9PEZI|nr:hypothetical protein VPNG_09618 [Cytospora leucostoma]
MKEECVRDSIPKTSELVVLTDQDIMTLWIPIRDRVGGTRCDARLPQARPLAKLMPASET